jgi:hypothetical protein
MGAWGGIVVKAMRYQSDGPGINSRWCHWIFQWHISFRLYHGPGVHSAPSENEYQEHFLGVKAVGAWGWQPHHLHVPRHEIREPKPPGTLWATPGLLRDSFTFLYIYTFSSPGWKEVNCKFHQHSKPSSLRYSQFHHFKPHNNLI